MNKYKIYRSNQYLVCEKQNEYSNNIIIDNLDEFYEILDRFIDNDYDISIKDKNVILLGANDTIELVDYIEVVNCSYLKELKASVDITYSKKGVIDQKEVVEPNDAKNIDDNKDENNKNIKSVRRFKKIGIFGLNIVMVTSLLGSSLVLEQKSMEKNNENLSDDSSYTQTSNFIPKQYYSFDVSDKAPIETLQVINSFAHRDNSDDIFQLNHSDDNDLENEKVGPVIRNENIYMLVNEDDDDSVEILNEDTLEQQNNIFLDENNINELEEIAVEIPNFVPNIEIEEIIIDERDVFDNYISTYASYYHFDIEKVLEIAHKLTNNYEIPLIEINNTDAYDLNSDEAACLIFINQLNRDNLILPISQFGYTFDDLILDNSIETLNDDLVLSSGYTFSQFLGKVSDLLNLDKNYALAVSYSECGRQTDSYQARTKNNFGGVKYHGEFITYTTPESGIIGFCRSLKKYENYNLTNMEDFCLSYVCYYSQDWINNVSSNHDMIEANNDVFFISETNENKEEFINEPTFQKTLN